MNATDLTLSASRDPNAADIEFRNFAASFVPPPLRSGDDAKDRVTREEATVLIWFDIAGFTALSATFFERGQDGIEGLSQLLDDYHRVVLAAVMRYGGEPLMFAGDGLLSAWQCGVDPREAALRAMRCASDVAQGDECWQGRVNRPDLYAVMAMGPCRTLEIGSSQDSLPVSLGRGVRDVQATARERISRRVVMSAAICSLLRGAIETAPTGNGAAVLLAIRETVRPPTAQPP